MTSRLGSSVEYTVLALPRYSSCRFSMESPSNELAPAETQVLIGNADPIRIAIERCGERRTGKPGQVIVLAQVRGDQMLETRVVEPGQQTRGRAGVEVSELARNPLLERKRVIAVGKQVEIVIALEHQRVAAGEARFDVRSGYAKIGQNAQPPVPVGADELHRLARVVRHGKGPDFYIANLEHIVAVETVYVRQDRETLRDHCQRAESEPYGCSEPRRERRDAADMIGMLVRDDDRGNGLGRDADPREPRDRVPDAEPAIDQHPRRADLDQQAIAFAAAAQRRETHAASARRGRSARGRGHLSWSCSSARILSLLAVRSATPAGSWTVTTLAGSACVTTTRYCSGFSLSSVFQNWSLSSHPFCLASRSGLA